MRQMLWANKHVKALKKSSMHLYESYMSEERMIQRIEMAIRRSEATVSSLFALMPARFSWTPADSYTLFGIIFRLVFSLSSVPASSIVENQ